MALTEVASRPLTRGASFAAVTVVPRATVALEKAVAPPLLETLMVLPLTRPEAEESTSLVVREPGVPLKLAAGRKRTLVAAVRNRPEVSASDVEMVVQVPALFHCQLPWAEVAALLVMTTPRRELAAEPPFTVSELSEKRVKKRLVTVSPAGDVLSSLTDGSVAEPVATGASLIELTVSATVSVAEEKAVEAPLELVSTLLPTVPEVRSQALKVRTSVMLPL